MASSRTLLRLYQHSTILRIPTPHTPRSCSLNQSTPKGHPSTQTQRQTMATTTTNKKPTAESNTISAIAQQEGRTAKDSTSATMQSELTRQRNAERAENEISAKLANAPETVTADDARYVQSREVRATGTVVSDLPSVAARQANANNEGGERGTNNANANAAAAASPAASGSSSGDNHDPSTQSRLDREANYIEAANTIQAKLESDPESITEDEARSMHRREQRALGHTDKGGLAARAQSRVAGN